jgi:hypothetical protein
VRAKQMESKMNKSVVQANGELQFSQKSNIVFNMNNAESITNSQINNKSLTGNTSLERFQTARCSFADQVQQVIQDRASQQQVMPTQQQQ